jgi:hypothetical protein
MIGLIYQTQFLSGEFLFFRLPKIIDICKEGEKVRKRYDLEEVRM